MSDVAGRVRRRIGGLSLKLLGVAAAIGAVAAGIAVADSGSPPAAGYVTVSPPAKVFSGSIGANKTVSAVAIGGATTVPTNATAVKMTLTIKSTQEGVLIIYPAGDPTAPDSQNVSYTAGTSGAIITATVGTKDDITIHNAGSAAATVTAEDDGYSTQVTATNIAPDGGSAGQVLTNTGTGATWQQAGGPSYGASSTGSTVLPADALSTVALQPVPAGSYQITATGTAFNESGGPSVPSDSIYCRVVSPSENVVTDAFVTLATTSTVVPITDVAMTGLLTTSGGTIQMQCQEEGGQTTTAIYRPSLVVTQVSSASGSVASAATQGAKSSAIPILPRLRTH